MKYLLEHLKREIILLFILLLVSGNTISTNGEELNGKKIVAVVEGIEIEYQKVAEDQIIFLFKLANGYEPGTKAERMEIENERMNREKEIIASRIRGVIFDKQKERFAIKITEKELAARWKELSIESDFDKAAKETRNSIRVLLPALKSVYEDGEDKDAVYNKLLVDKMTKLDWEIQHNYYRTPEMRKALEDGLKISGDDLRKPNIASRAMVEREEINKYIDLEISNKDSEFAEYKNILEKDPKNKKLQKFDPNYIEAQRHRWWQEQYKKSKIEIKDDRFKDVIQMLMPNAKEEKSIK